MKVYFSVIGIGLGHMTRCLAIAERLKRNGVECVFSSYGHASDIASSLGYRTYRSIPMSWFQDENGVVDFESTFLKTPIFFKKMSRHFRDEIHRIRLESPDMVISDSRYTSIPASKDTKVPRLYITNQPRILMPREDDGTSKTTSPLEMMGCWVNYRLLSGQDRILIPDFPLPYSISKRHMMFHDAPSKFIDKAQFIGPISAQRPRREISGNVDAVCEKYGVKPGNYIYIAFSGPGTIDKRITDVINAFFKNHHLPGIMGTGTPGKTRINREGDMILVDGWIEDRAELMEGAKFVITRGGLSTISEVVAFGKPSIVIPQGNQPEQESNAMGVEDLGIGLKLEPREMDLLPEKVEQLLNSEHIFMSALKWKRVAAKWKGEEKAERMIMELLG